MALRRLPLSNRDSNFSGLAVSSGVDLSPSEMLQKQIHWLIFYILTSVCKFSILFSIYLS